MLRTLRVRLARAAAAALVLGAVAAGLPQSAAAGGWYHGPRVHAGFWLPFPPPPPFFFPPAPPVVIYRQRYYDRPYYYRDHDRYDRYRDRHERWDDRHDRWNDRHERWD